MKRGDELLFGGAKEEPGIIWMGLAYAETRLFVVGGATIQDSRIKHQRDAASAI